MKKFFTDIINSIRNVKPAEGADQGALVNQIADAMSAPMEKVGDEIENTITNKIAEGLKGETVTNLINAAVKTAVENATKELNTKVANLETAKAELEKKNGELEQEITNKLGAASTANKEAEGQQPVGSFKK